MALKHSRTKSTIPIRSCSTSSAGRRRTWPSSSAAGTRWRNRPQDAQGGKRELDEALRSLGLRDPANRKRAGGAASDNQRDLRDAATAARRRAKYRDLFDAFRKGAAAVARVI